MRTCMEQQLHILSILPNERDWKDVSVFVATYVCDTSKYQQTALKMKMIQWEPGMASAIEVYWDIGLLPSCGMWGGAWLSGGHQKHRAQKPGSEESMTSAVEQWYEIVRARLRLMVYPPTVAGLKLYIHVGIYYTRTQINAHMKSRIYILTCTHTDLTEFVRYVVWGVSRSRSQLGTQKKSPGFPLYVTYDEFHLSLVIIRIHVKEVE